MVRIGNNFEKILNSLQNTVARYKDLFLLFLKFQIYFFMMLAVIVAVVAPFAYAGEAEEPESLLSNAEGSSDSKPFNLQAANGQRRAHGIYFNGR